MEYLSIVPHVADTALEFLAGDTCWITWCYVSSAHLYGGVNIKEDVLTARQPTSLTGRSVLILPLHIVS